MRLLHPPLTISGPACRISLSDNLCYNEEKKKSKQITLLFVFDHVSVMFRSAPVFCLDVAVLELDHRACQVNFGHMRRDSTKRESWVTTVFVNVVKIRILWFSDACVQAVQSTKQTKEVNKKKGELWRVSSPKLQPNYLHLLHVMASNHFGFICWGFKISIARISACTWRQWEWQDFISVIVIGLHNSKIASLSVSPPSR